VTRIHPTAVVDPGAELAEGVEIGPCCVVEEGARLGPGVRLHSHVHVFRNTEIGAQTTVFPFASLGALPQDLKYGGEATRVVIGEHNQIREHVTIHGGTAFGGGLTRVGDRNLLMVGAHIAHDCRVGSHVILGNGVLLAGHVAVEDYAVINADAAVQQFLRVGESSYLAAKAGLMQDLPPFVWSQGHPARALRINRVGLERRGFRAERIAPIERAFRVLFRSKLTPRQGFASVREHLACSEDVQKLLAFLEKSERGFVRVRRASAAPDATAAE
jgi:UDP-N-acetylglucosamine acyltransferase